MSEGIKKCCAPGCASSSRDIHLSLFRFPKDELRCSFWKQLLGNPEYVEYTSVQCYNRLRLCSLHFREECFSSKLKNRLKNNAVPSFTIDKLTESLKDIASHKEVEVGEPPMRSIYISPVPTSSRTGEVLLGVVTQIPLSLSSQNTRKECLMQALKDVSGKLERKARPFTGADIAEVIVSDFLDGHFSEYSSDFVTPQMPLLGKSPDGSRNGNNTLSPIDSSMAVSYEIDVNPLVDESYKLETSHTTVKSDPCQDSGNIEIKPFVDKSYNLETGNMTIKSDPDQGAETTQNQQKSMMEYHELEECLGIKSEDLDIKKEEDEYDG